MKRERERERERGKEREREGKREGKREREREGKREGKRKRERGRDIYFYLYTILHHQCERNISLEPSRQCEPDVGVVVVAVVVLL